MLGGVRPRQGQELDEIVRRRAPAGLEGAHTLCVEAQWIRCEGFKQ